MNRAEEFILILVALLTAVGIILRAFHLMNYKREKKRAIKLKKFIDQEFT